MITETVDSVIVYHADSLHKCITNRWARKIARHLRRLNLSLRKPLKGAVGFHVASAEAKTLHDKGSNVWCKRMLEKAYSFLQR